MLAQANNNLTNLIMIIILIIIILIIIIIITYLCRITISVIKTAINMGPGLRKIKK